MQIALNQGLLDISQATSNGHAPNSALATATWLPDSTGLPEQQHAMREQQRQEIKHLSSSREQAKSGQKRT